MQQHQIAESSLHYSLDTTFPLPTPHRLWHCTQGYAHCTDFMAVTDDGSRPDSKSVVVSLLPPPFFLRQQFPKILLSSPFPFSRCSSCSSRLHRVCRRHKRLINYAGGEVSDSWPHCEQLSQKSLILRAHVSWVFYSNNTGFASKPVCIM